MSDPFNVTHEFTSVRNTVPSSVMLNPGGLRSIQTLRLKGLLSLTSISTL